MGLEFEIRDIFKEPLSEGEFKSMHKKSGVSADKFINLKGRKLKELGLKDKISSMSDQEKYELLASDPKLVKRPIIDTDKGFIFGFDKEGIKEILS